MLSFEEPTTWSADRYVGRGEDVTPPAINAAMRPPFCAARVTLDSALCLAGWPARQDDCCDYESGADSEPEPVAWRLLALLAEPGRVQGKDHREPDAHRADGRSRQEDCHSALVSLCLGQNQQDGQAERIQARDEGQRNGLDRHYLSPLPCWPGGAGRSACTSRITRLLWSGD